MSPTVAVSQQTGQG